MMGRAEWLVLRKLLSSTRVSRIGKFGDIYRGEINQSQQVGCIVDRDTGFRLWRGSNLRAYRVVSVARQGELKFIDASRLKKDFPTNFSKASQRRIVTQQNTGTDDSVRIEAAVLPKGEVLAESANAINNIEDEKQFWLTLGALNSTLLDWYFSGFSTTNHVTTDELANLPMIEITDDKSVHQKATTLLGKLIDGREEPSAIWDLDFDIAASCLSQVSEKIYEKYLLIDKQLHSSAEMISEIVQKDHDQIWKILDSNDLESCTKKRLYSVSGGTLSVRI